MNLATKVAKNTLIQLFGKAITLLVSAITVSFIARYLQPEKFGFYSIALTILSFVAFFADLGFYNASICRLASLGEDEKKFKKHFGAILSFRFVFALAVYLLAALIVFLCPLNSILKTAFLILSLSSFFSSLNMTFVGMLQTRYQMIFPAIAEITNRLVVFALVMLIFSLRLHYTWVFWAVTAGMAINLVMLAVFSKKYLALNFHLRCLKIFEFVKESIFLGLIGFFATLIFRVDLTVLSLLKTPFEVGVYGAAFKIFEMLVLIPTVFVGMMLPSYSQTVNSDFKKFETLLQKTINLLSLAVFPIVLFFNWGSAWFVRIFVGQSFSASALPLSLLSWALFPYFFSSAISLALISGKKTKSLFKISLVTAILSVFGMLLAVWQWSYIGAAGAVIIVQLLFAFLCNRCLEKDYSFKVDLSVFKKMLWPFLFANSLALLFYLATTDIEMNIVNSLISLLILGAFDLIIFFFAMVKLKFVSFTKSANKFGIKLFSQNWHLGV